MAIKRLRLMADFETTTDPKDVRVWAGCAVDIDKLEVAFLGTHLEDFIHFLSDKSVVCYFHNLRFDGEYILHYLLSHGFKWEKGRDKDGKKLPFKEKHFRTLITDDGLFYSIEVCFSRINSKKMCKTTFYDSYKKLPFPVAKIATGFGLPMTKGEIDYKAYRSIDHVLTEEEKDYIIRDCKIVAEALKVQFEQGLTKMTNASDAMASYKETIGNKFVDWFPTLPAVLDDNIRKAYKGGFVYLNPKYKNVRGTKGRSYDVNSLYPSVMYEKLLPFGYPVFFEGRPEPTETYPLYIVHLTCCFQLREGYIPMLQLKKNRRFVETEYLTSSWVKVGNQWENEPVEMYLTSVDYELFKEHYIITRETLIDGWKFKGATGMFKTYIDYWMHIKETETGPKRQLAKLQLNSLYGRFALSTRTSQKIPYLDEKNVVRYEYSEEETREPVYTAMGCFITAYAREKTIRSAQANYDRFIYADTDSLKLTGYEDAEGLEVHNTHLGAWKDEGNFSDSKWIRCKTYMVTVDGKTKVTCAGMPDNVKEKVTYENFCPGSTFEGKLMPRRYPGGIVLEETTFTIK